MTAVRSRLVHAAAVVLAVAAASPAIGQELARGTLERWLAEYEQAWETRDAERAASIFTPDATYHETPFDPPKLGQAGIREYWSTVTADQRDIDFRSEIIALDGPTGIAQWSATFTVASTGAKLELDGVFVLTFDAAGRCTELREWWQLRTL